MEQLTPEQRARLIAARESKGFTVEQVAELSGIPAQHLHLLETEGYIIPSAFMHLTHDIYRTSMHDILHGPYPYETPEAWIEAYLREEISEELLAHNLKTDIVDARRQVQEYQRAREQQSQEDAEEEARQLRIANGMEQ